MKGLYLNVPGAADLATGMAATWGAPISVHTESFPRLGSVTIATHAGAADRFRRDEAADVHAAFSGWVMYRGAVGSPWQLVKDLAAASSDTERIAVLRNIDGGCFLLLVDTPSGAFAVTDPFELHPHYAPAGRPLEAIAPAPSFLPGEHAPDPFRTTLLNRVNHLFGNATGFADIDRLPPGSLITAGGARSYPSYDPEPAPPAETLRRIREGIAAFTDAPRMAPLSGGLDSRLLLSSGEFASGYTMGPADSGDRPVARQFRHRMGRYLEFSLRELHYPQATRREVLRMFEGTCPRPFAELMVVLRHVHDQLGHAYSFDGLFGDVLQRGLYLGHAGARGSAAKLIPALTLSGFEPVAFLTRKYRLAGEEARWLAERFEEHAGDLPGDGPHRVLLFEMLYGRGSRHVVNGSTIMSGQFFPVVQPFALLPVYRTLFATSAADWLSFRLVHRLWREVPAEFCMRTASGFSPRWNPHLGRAIMLATRALPRLGVNTRAISYEHELREIAWTA